MKNFSNRYKIVASVFIVFIMTISLMFTFLVGKKQVDGNVFYYVVKGIAMAALIAILIMIWMKNASFHKLMPLSIAAIIYQAVPALCRIHSNGQIPTAIYFLVVIISFVFLIPVLLYGVSNDQFKEAENKAKKSSNSRR